MDMVADLYYAMAAQRLMKKTTPPLTREGVVQVISYVSRRPKSRYYFAIL